MSASEARVGGVACETATGGRGYNQDRCEALILEPAQSLWGFRAALVVADGMGGHEKGDQAAEIAIQAATEVLSARLQDHATFAGDFPGAEPEDVVRGAFDRANQRIYEWAVTQDVSGDTGTTLTVIVCTDEQVVVGNVGDSRAYVVGRDAVRKLSEEHSWVGEQVRLGRLTEEEAATSPLRNQLTQAVGCDPAIDPHLVRMPLEPSSVYIACTDGLTEVVDADAIREVVQAGGPPEDLCRALVALAVAAGTSDNVTVAVLATEPGVAAEAPPEPAAEAPQLAPPPDIPPIVESEPPDRAVAAEEPAPEASPEVQAPDEPLPVYPDPPGEGEPTVARQRTQRLGMALIVCVVSLLLGLLVGRATVSTDEPLPAPPPPTTAPVAAPPATPPDTSQPVADSPPAGAPQTVVVEARCEGNELIVTCSEELALDVYPKDKYGDPTAHLQELGETTPGATRYRLPETPASWSGQTVKLTIERAGAGTLRLSPSPQAKVYVDQKPYQGEALSSVKPEGSRARIGFYFPSGDDDQAHAIAIVGFRVEGPA